MKRDHGSWCVAGGRDRTKSESNIRDYCDEHRTWVNSGKVVFFDMLGLPRTTRVGLHTASTAYTWTHTHTHTHTHTTHPTSKPSFMEGDTQDRRRWMCTVRKTGIPAGRGRKRRTYTHERTHTHTRACAPTHAHICMYTQSRNHPSISQPAKT